MTDTPSARYGAREQSLGSNTNNWGDTKLNQVIDLLDRGSKGYQALAVTGDATITWTNYVATNDGQVATLKLTGSPSAAFTLTFPSKEWELAIWNATTQSATIKCSGGTGVVIPTLRRVRLFCDATDIGDNTPNYLPTATTLTNNQDIVSSAQLSSAIGALSGTANGLVLTSNTATQAQYLNIGLQSATAGGIALTKTSAGTPTEYLAASLDIVNMTVTTNVAAADRFPVYDTTAGVTGYQTRANVAGKYGLVLQSMITAATVAAGNFYPVDCTTASKTICLPSSATVGDAFGFAVGGPNAMGINPNGLNVNGATTTIFVDGDQTVLLTYWGASRGYV